MSQWYFSYDGKQFGPMDQNQVMGEAKSHPGGLAWREGFTDWLPVDSIPELSGGVPASAAPATPTPASGSASDVIDFKVFGEDMQFVEVELDPGESAVAEAGTMMYKGATVQMHTVFGDGSQQQQAGGFLDKLVGAGKRLITGESLFMTVFTHEGQGKAHAAFAAPYPGTIIPLSLRELGGTLICQKDAFLCAAKGVSIGIHFQKKILTGLFGGEGFIMQKLEGDGMVFVHAGGTIVKRTLGPGEQLHVDTGCVVAIEPTVEFDIQQVGGIKSMFFGGEGVFFASLRGPGKVWMQSLPFSRLAGRMLSAAPQKGGSRGEGSILGGLGGLLDGDNSF